jgi:acetyl esterase/lipase
MKMKSSFPSLVIGFLATMALSASADTSPMIQQDVVYGHKDGMALIFDVVRPEKPNGAGILYIQSGGWYSGWSDPRGKLPACAPLLVKGFTVFLVYHGSSPRYAVPDAVEDVRRAARYIHLHAKELGVDPDRLGALGGSAGGHLSLMLGTTGDDGNPNAKDEVLKQSSRLAAVVALYPPTDLRKWTTDPPPACLTAAPPEQGRCAVPPDSRGQRRTRSDFAQHKHHGCG